MDMTVPDGRKLKDTVAGMLPIGGHVGTSGDRARSGEGLMLSVLSETAFRIYTNETMVNMVNGAKCIFTISPFILALQ